MKLRLIDRACALGVFTAAVFAAPTAPAQSCNDGYHPDVDNWVSAMALQADGKVVIGGAFTNVGGVTRRFIARLNADGSLDLGFNPGAGSHVLALTVQPDGKILVGGLFYTLGGRQKHCLGRLNPDGSVDTSFSAVVVEGSGVYSLLIQSDGKTVVGGLFRTLSTSLGGQVRTNLARLNGDGTIDSFNPGAGHYHSESVGGVFCLAQQPDGQLLVGGDYPSLAGQPCSSVGRLNPDGTLDTTFPTNADRRVHSIALQPDGKVLLGGFFSTVGGIGQKHLARFHGDGTPDTSFTPNVNSNVLAIALQPDGKILVGGTFTNINGEIRNRIARLQPDGSLDGDFNPGATDLVTELAVQSDGKIMVTGFFGGLGGRCRSRLGRLHPNGTVESRPWPQISKPALLSNGTFQLSFFGDRYRSIVVQASTNLTQWQSIGSYCCAPVYFSFPDFQATNHPRRFYRLYVP